MSLQAQATPAPRRGRPRKAAIPSNPQFPGNVIPLSSVPRLRVGVLCELINQDGPMASNNGRRVIIKTVLEDGRFHISPMAGTILAKDVDGSNSNVTNAAVAGSSLYRIGAIREAVHV